MTIKYPHLFSPVTIGPLALSHRVVMAPLTRSRSEQPGRRVRPARKPPSDVSRNARCAGRPIAIVEAESDGDLVDNAFGRRRPRWRLTAEGVRPYQNKQRRRRCDGRRGVRPE